MWVEQFDRTNLSVSMSTSLKVDYSSDSNF